MKPLQKLKDALFYVVKRISVPDKKSLSCATELLISEALVAAANDNYEEALKKLKRGIEKNSSVSSYELGVLFETIGDIQVLKDDLCTAVQYYKKASVLLSWDIDSQRHQNIIKKLEKCELKHTCQTNEPVQIVGSAIDKKEKEEAAASQPKLSWSEFQYADKADENAEKMGSTVDITVNELKKERVGVDNNQSNTQEKASNNNANIPPGYYQESIEKFAERAKENAMYRLLSCYNSNYFDAGIKQIKLGLVEDGNKNIEKIMQGNYSSILRAEEKALGNFIIDKFDCAIKYLKKALDEKPDCAYYYLFLAVAYAIKKDYSAAFNAIDMISKIKNTFGCDDMDMALAQEISGDIFTWQRKTKEAAGAYEEALRSYKCVLNDGYRYPKYNAKYPIEDIERAVKNIKIKMKKNNYDIVQDSNTKMKNEKLDESYF